MAKLEIISGPESGRKYQIDHGRYIVGRGEDCELRLNEASISRHHAAFEWNGEIWRVEDLNSQNGVFLDNRKITQMELPQTTRLRFGTNELIFSPDAGPEEAGPDIEDSQDEDALAVATVAPPETSPAAAASQPQNFDKIREMAQIYGLIESEFGKVIIGQREVLEQLLTAMAAGGHCLMIGLPGLAKTLMISTLSRILQLSFKRVQFTPDLMPADIIGTEVLEINDTTGQKSFRFIKGPIFTNMLLADEINRTPPKTQAALLESMQERQVTVANHVFPLPPPFFVLATQNPLEQEGTYPLPEAQLDRFMFNIMVDYPTMEDEESIVQETTARRDPDLKQALSGAEIIRLQAAVRDLPVSPHVVKYATRLVRATRPKDESAPMFIKEYIACGAGPRAAQNLILGAKAKAVIHGRLNVSCEDVRSQAYPVLRHRLFTTFTADSEGITPDDLIRKLLEAIPEPAAGEYTTAPLKAVPSAGKK